ncbi:LacI family DNA-binding transcriptional regulator [Labedaea rhizosphaerae]|uniref:LacI family transcriptional regulator n=1 Tax=Labedaea rhizosphaerae TaxID=598644 RepID=A0A4R6SJH0_LABRH|nr:LacI family DNA-binding transcriptional regulator [Labedaea rhizosphaerae]TDQ01536.1 LacI family transcriptional regulator [Labedaea rhizosphaerae]
MSDRAPTLEDVARAAGVSRATVSRVVNGVRNVDPGIRAKVTEAIDDIGYRPNRAARSLVTRRTDAIALVVSGAEDQSPGEVFADPFFGRVAGGVVAALGETGQYPLLMHADSGAGRDRVLDALRSGMVHGALLVSTRADDPLPHDCVAEKVPAVLFARPTRPVPISYVDLEHRQGAALAADHLVARGCRRVATITGPATVPASQDRRAGFRDAMARHGQPYVPEAEGNFTLASGEAAMERLLADHPDLDGVFAGNDLMAQGAVQVLRQHGRAVPGDVAVVGFDDSSAAAATRPPLTTIRQPVEDMAAAMVRLLLDRLAGEEQPRSVIFEPVLVIRESA